MVIGGDVDESVRPEEAAEDYCRRVAREKAVRVWEKHGRARDDVAVVIGADTVVVLDGKVLGQPGDQDEARAMLKQLNGRQHSVMTGVCLVHGRSGHIDELLVESKVWMRNNDMGTIEDYVMSGEPIGKAGAYALQGRGGRLIERYAGSRTNIIGLPMDELKEALSRIAW